MSELWGEVVSGRGDSQSIDKAEGLKSQVTRQGVAEVFVPCPYYPPNLMWEILSL